MRNVQLPLMNSDLPNEWFVRVEGKEYGPVDMDTLQEWRAEGRVIPQNYLRRKDDSAWVLASSLPELFPAVPPPLPPNELFRRRTLAEIFAETFRIYRKGFFSFLVLSFLVAAPSLGWQVSLHFVHFPENGVAPKSTLVAAAVCVVMIAILLAVWPIFIGGIQFGVKEIAEGRKLRLGPLVRRAVNYWPRIARLCVLVYGSFLFWCGLPALLALSLAATPSLTSILLALMALSFQVYMFGRLFTNFLFWQQACTIGELDGIEALRESKELARSRKSEPLPQRPLCRGAVIVSLWVLVLIFVGILIEMPFTIGKLQELMATTNFDDPSAMMQKMMNVPLPDTKTVIIINVLSSLANAVLRPLLGIAFVVLYFDAKSTR